MSKALVIQFAEHLSTNQKSRSTVIAYTKDLEQLMEFTGKNLEEIISDDLKVVVEQMRDSSRFTFKTISRKINSYRTFYKFLGVSGVINHNPTTEIKHPKLTPKPPRVLSSIEYLALREVSRDNPRLYTMIELILQTGIRIGELSRLQIKDIDLRKNRGEIYIKAFSTTDARTVNLNGKAFQLLKNFLSAIDASNPEAPLFSTRDGKPIIIRNIRSSVDRAMARAGIKNACVNDLRNTFIVAQLQAGLPVDAVAQAVGHRSRTTTSKYLELLEQEYKPSADSKLIDL